MLRVPLESLSAGPRQLPATTAHYATRVHRLGPGARLLLFDPEARLEAEAEIVEVGARVTARLDEPRQSTALPRRRVTVIQGIGKGNTASDVLRDATELGATRFIAAQCERSVKRPQEGIAGRWQRVAVEAARQCGRGDIPDVVGPVTLAEALSSVGPALAVLLHPEADATLGAILREEPSTAPVAVAIGPEGGFSESEIELAAKHGFRKARLGQFVLRTETACAAALGAIAAAS